MAKQENIRLNLAKLKEAVDKSSNIKNEIKDLLEKVTIDSVGAEVSKLSKDQAFELYQTRFHLLESRGVYNESFANLLKRLGEVDNSVHLIITVLQVEGKSYIVFTDKDYNECFGIIY